MHFILHRISTLSNPLPFRHLHYFVALQFKTIVSGAARINLARRTLYTPAPFQHERKLLRRDNLSSDYHLIYRIQKCNFYISCTCVAYVCFALAVYFLCKMFTRRELIHVQSSEKLMREIGTSAFYFQEEELICLSVFSIFVPFFLYIFTKRIPLRIYFNGEKYVAVFMNSFCPLLKTNYTFTGGRRNKSSFTVFGTSSFIIGRRRARLFTDNFRRPVDLHLMINEFFDEPEIRSDIK